MILPSFLSLQAGYKPCSLSSDCSVQSLEGTTRPISPTTYLSHHRALSSKYHTGSLVNPALFQDGPLDGSGQQAALSYPVIKLDPYRVPHYESSDDRSSLNDTLFDECLQVDHHEHCKYLTTPPPPPLPMAKPNSCSSTESGASNPADSQSPSQFLRLTNTAVEMVDPGDVDAWGGGSVGGGGGQARPVGTFLMYDQFHSIINLPCVYWRDRFLGIWMNSFNLQRMLQISVSYHADSSGQDSAWPPLHTSMTTVEQVLIAHKHKINSARFLFKLILFEPKRFHFPSNYPFPVIHSGQRIVLR